MEPLINTINELIFIHDQLALKECELGLGELGELRDEIELANQRGENFLTMPAEHTKSGQEEIIYFSPNILDK
jgi:hypothetical protein